MSITNMECRYFVAENVGVGTTIIAAGAPGKCHKVVGIMLSGDNKATLFRLVGPANLTGDVSLFNTSPALAVFSPQLAIVQAAPGAALSIVVSGAGAVSGTIVYVTEA
jgi:hypothetical protein